MIDDDVSTVEKELYHLRILNFFPFHLPLQLWRRPYWSPCGASMTSWGPHSLRRLMAMPRETCRSPPGASWTGPSSPWPTATCCLNFTYLRWLQTHTVWDGNKYDFLRRICYNPNPHDPLTIYVYVKVVAKKYRGFEIPAEMTGLLRYLNRAYEREEFTKTCPAEREIQFAYLDVAKRIK